MGRGKSEPISNTRRKRDHGERGKERTRDDGIVADRREQRGSMYHLGWQTAKEKGHRSGEHESTAKHIHGHDEDGETAMEDRHPVPGMTGGDGGRHSCSGQEGEGERRREKEDEAGVVVVVEMEEGEKRKKEGRRTRERDNSLTRSKPPPWETQAVAEGIVFFFSRAGGDCGFSFSFLLAS